MSFCDYLMVEAAKPRLSNEAGVEARPLDRVRDVVRKQYWAVNRSMAKPYALCEPGEPRLLRTEDLEWSRSGSRRMVFR